MKKIAVCTGEKCKVVLDIRKQGNLTPKIVSSQDEVKKTAGFCVKCYSRRFTILAKNREMKSN